MSVLGNYKEEIPSKNTEIEKTISSSGRKTIKCHGSAWGMPILNVELTRDGWNLTAWAPCPRKRLCPKQRGLEEIRPQRPGWGPPVLGSSTSRPRQSFRVLQRISCVLGGCSLALVPLNLRNEEGEPKAPPTSGLVLS